MRNSKASRAEAKHSYTRKLLAECWKAVSLTFVYFEFTYPKNLQFLFVFSSLISQSRSGLSPKWLFESSWLFYDEFVQRAKFGVIENLICSQTGFSTAVFHVFNSLPWFHIQLINYDLDFITWNLISSALNS